MELFDPRGYEAPSEDWSPDDWETPPEVAKFMGSLVTEGERSIIEPSAGTGSIVRCLPRDRAVICYELNFSRLEKGHRENSDGSREWRHADFLEASLALGRYLDGVDLVIGNPPFSLGMEFLKASARCLSKKNPNARTLFLLPTEYFQSQARARLLRESGLVITKQWQIAGRVGFLKNGKPENKRQCYDSVFEFKRAGRPAVELVDVYMRLGGLA